MENYFDFFKKFNSETCFYLILINSLKLYNTVLIKSIVDVVLQNMTEQLSVVMVLMLKILLGWCYHSLIVITFSLAQSDHIKQCLLYVNISNTLNTLNTSITFNMSNTSNMPITSNLPDKLNMSTTSNLSIT